MTQMFKASWCNSASLEAIYATEDQLPQSPASFWLELFHLLKSFLTSSHISQDPLPSHPWLIWLAGGTDAITVSVYSLLLVLGT